MHTFWIEIKVETDMNKTQAKKAVARLITGTGTCGFGGNLTIKGCSRSPVRC